MLMSHFSYRQFFFLQSMLAPVLRQMWWCIGDFGYGKECDGSPQKGSTWANSMHGAGYQWGILVACGCMHAWGAIHLLWPGVCNFSTGRRSSPLRVLMVIPRNVGIYRGARILLVCQGPVVLLSRHRLWGGLPGCLCIRRILAWGPITRKSSR